LEQSGIVSGAPSFGLHRTFNGDLHEWPPQIRLSLRVQIAILPEYGVGLLFTVLTMQFSQSAFYRFENQSHHITQHYTK